MSDDTRARIEAFLDANHVMNLATVGEEGAHAASLFYVRRELDLYWTSDPATRHSAHIDRDARVTVTVAPDCDDFRVIRGLQLAGRARRLTAGDEAAVAEALLVERYPFLAQLASGPPKLRAAFESAGFYVFEPASIVFIDNTRGFGHKERLDVAR